MVTIQYILHVPKSVGLLESHDVIISTRRFYWCATDIHCTLLVLGWHLY